MDDRPVPLCISIRIRQASLALSGNIRTDLIGIKVLGGKSEQHRVTVVVNYNQE